jgi:methionine-rich copper-binding protein CopC
MTIFCLHRPAALGLLAMGLVASTANVSAMANYVSSNPAPNQSFYDSPGQVDMTFSEALVGGQIAVVSPHGDNLTYGFMSKLDPNDPTHLSTKFRPSGGPGTYKVAWASFSAVDRKPAAGSFTFSVQCCSANAQSVDDDAVTLGMDDRVSSYRKRQAIRDTYREQIDEAVFNDRLHAGRGLEVALADARAVQSKAH